ncbi:DNA topoisomerase IV [Aquimarina sp. ERC-38]|uniref:DNA topoisomerase IV n=1 Tax=Aquimarina sp. ERC-38 TaxID=2949996 RepID=UPI00224610E7|nr:DNA topoisomerase IV [Aquimarina sp. ERC-38]UZO79970.1 DNA topoisomerase IV [Aquimarina sp. ERC-38]
MEKQVSFMMYVSVLIFGLFTKCTQIERKCIDFQQGTFEFETFLNGELAKTTFVRNDSIEIDFFRGKSDTASIRWINNCEYIVKKLHPTNRKEEKALHMKILTTKGNTYTFEYGLVGQTKDKQIGTVKKIN